MSRSRWPEIAEVIVAFAPSMATAHAHLLAMKIAALYDAALLADTPSVEPAGLEQRFAAWIVETHPPKPAGDAIFDWACAECIEGYHDAKPVPGFRCIPHAALALLPTQASDSPEKP